MPDVNPELGAAAIAAASSRGALAGLGAAAICRWPTAPLAYYCRVPRVEEVLDPADPSRVAAVNVHIEACADGSLGPIQDPLHSQIEVRYRDTSSVMAAAAESRSTLRASSDGSALQRGPSRRGDRVTGTLNFPVPGFLQRETLISQVQFRFGDCYPLVTLRDCLSGPRRLSPMSSTPVPAPAPQPEAGVDENNSTASSRELLSRQIEETRETFLQEFGVAPPRSTADVEGFVSELLRRFPTLNTNDSAAAANADPADDMRPLPRLEGEAWGDDGNAGEDLESEGRDDVVASSNNDDAVANAATDPEESAAAEQTRVVGNTESSTSSSSSAVPGPSSGAQAEASSDSAAQETTAALQTSEMGITTQDGAVQTIEIIEAPVGTPCIICLEETADATFVHGSTGHTVCCYACATRVRLSSRPRCPICRERPERVIRNFFS